jgi:GTP:adenosylcobinamide-phosphate guanylyltransferase
VTAKRYTALVLAGRRSGEDDPVALAAGVAHKALAVADGLTLIGRVIAALRAAPSIGDILVATNDTDVAAAADGATIVPAGPSPSATVAQLVERMRPLLVTTADHALLSGVMVEAFCAGIPPTGDVAVGIVPWGVFAERSRRRTFYRLADGAYCGANLYAFIGPRSRAAARYWIRVEAERKHPVRLLKRVGFSIYFRYALGSLDLATAFRLLSRRADATISPIVLQYPDAAIDVDTICDLKDVGARLSAGRRCDRSP